jgi:hypothetical protein
LIVTRLLAIFGVAVLLVDQAAAQTTGGSSAADSTDSASDQWSFSINVAGYVVPHDRSYASPTFSADHQQLHVGARYNYEDKETGSLWVGYNFSAGQNLALEVTPMIGGVFGKTTGVAPGYLASLSWKKIELSTEGEYVFDTKDSSGNFFYSWMELTYSPRGWCRAGLVAQRTKAYHTSLDIQRGLLVGFSHKKLDFTTYVFNAGWTDPTIVLSLGFNF